MLIRETFSESIAFKVINKYHQGAVTHISTVFGPITFKIYSRFWKMQKNREKVFFLDNLIWIVIVKFSLLRTGYLPSAANVLTKSSGLRFSIIDIFSNSNLLTAFNKSHKIAVIHIWTILSPVYHVAPGRVLWNNIFYTSNYVSESVISEIKNLSGSSFFRNVQNLI